MHKFLLMAALILTPAAHAGTVGLHLGSWHDTPGHNNFNPGAFYRSDSATLTGALKASASIGGYRNSLGHNTAYVAGNVEAGPFALSAGLGTGYGRYDANDQYQLRKLSPIGAVSVLIGQHWRIAVVPKLHSLQKGNTVHVAFEF